MKKLLLILLCLPMIGFGQDLSIGDTYQGGIIFYLDGNGSGLIAAPRDYKSQFTHRSLLLVIKDSVKSPTSLKKNVGDGVLNTSILIEHEKLRDPDFYSNNAASICKNLNLGGYSDWFLPSEYELWHMWKNLYCNGLGNFNKEDGNYLSSTTNSQGMNSVLYVNGILFDNTSDADGYNRLYRKDSYKSFRPIRAFSLDKDKQKISHKTNILLKEGDTFQGGIVFYIDGKGGGKIAAPTDLGKVNMDIAEVICENLNIGGYNDWYLPSKYELVTLFRFVTKLERIDYFKNKKKKLLREVLEKNNLGFKEESYSRYWSSSKQSMTIRVSDDDCPKKRCYQKVENLISLSRTSTLSGDCLTANCGLKLDYQSDKYNVRAIRAF